MKKRSILPLLSCGMLIFSPLTLAEGVKAETQETQETTSSSENESESTSQTEQEESTASSTTDTEEPAVVDDRQDSIEVRASDISGAGLKKIPYGAKKLDGVFDKLNSAGSGSWKNALVPQNPTDGTNDNRPYDEIQLSGSQNWLSVFSNDYQKLDFSKDFNGHVYINFNTGFTDGLAFVMHNDTRKSKAMTSATSDLDGQNLGVYGAYAGIGSSPYRNPAEKGIQNSVAVEFDMHGNWNEESDNFDRKVGLSVLNGPTHMAYSFPGNPTTYEPYNSYSSWTNSNGTPSTALQKHYVGAEKQGYQSLKNIVSNSWYEFRFNYVSGVGLVYYLFNPTNNTLTEPVVISNAELEANLKLSENNNTAYWGFSSANGNLAGTTKFAFTETPVESVATLSNQVYDKNNTEVTVPRDEAITDKFINSGDTVTLQSTYKLESSQRNYTINNWKGKIDPAAIAIPANKQINVTYSVNDGEAKTQNVAVDAKGNFSLDGLNLAIPREGGTVTFKFSLPTVNNLSAQKTVFYSSVNGRYGTDSFDTIIESDSNYFWINKRNNDPVIDGVTFDQTNFQDFVHPFGFKLSYHDDDAAANELKMKIEVNGQLVSESNLAANASQNLPWAETTKIDLLNENNIFTRGNNTLKVTLTDANGAVATKESTFNVEGYQGFEKVTKEYQWNYSRTQLPTDRKAQARENQMTIKARDTTKDKPTSEVTLSATQLSSNKNNLSASEFVFKENGQTFALPEVSFKPNQAYDFSKSDGLLLKLSDQDNPGEYKGVINWTIKDAP
ncbi:hypothetical protein KUA55_15425 [Enterococcus sp. ALS3]|uniref:WxL domain-containing protein n=1 Tax=Enterococcus alishanensis TaxID=1303817 RepID=A0ABS6TGH9_9ENTE|nr:hypothetical protein [Enterococcus alishanensis]MBV7392072.1 hypothetical protein [Enterococcus alishanensis]